MTNTRKRGHKYNVELSKKVKPTKTNFTIDIYVIEDLIYKHANIICFISDANHLTTTYISIVYDAKILV